MMRQKIRPGMIFLVVEWEERFEIKRIQKGTVVVQYFRDVDETEVLVWDLLRDLEEREIRALPTEDHRSRRQRRKEMAELRGLQKYAKLLDREWRATGHGGGR